MCDESVLAGTGPRYKKRSRRGFNHGPLLVLLLIYYTLPVVCTSRYILLAKRSILTLKCREAQGQFRIHWRPGKTNLADYFTKHHAPAHHVNIRSEFLTRFKDLAEARSQRAKQGKTKPTYQGNSSYKGVLNLRYKRTYGMPTIG